MAVLRAHQQLLLVGEDSARMIDGARVANDVIHHVEAHLLSLVVGVDMRGHTALGDMKWTWLPCLEIGDPLAPWQGTTLAFVGARRLHPMQADWQALAMASE